MGKTSGKPAAELADGSETRANGRKLVVPTVSVTSFDGHGSWLARSVGASSANSTTSEVNSLDGAESIVSRLSEIVDEQELLMQQLVSQPAARTSSPGEPHRLRASSFGDGQQRGSKLEAARANLAKCRNESSNDLFSTASASQLQPARGNLRAPGGKRAAPEGDVSRCHRAGSAFDAGDRSMLNIRRSAWKLDEFEQAFRHSDSDSEESASNRAKRAQDLPSNQTGGSFHRQRSYSTSGNGSLLARASRRLNLKKSLSSALSGGHLLASAEKAPSQSDIANMQARADKNYTHQKQGNNLLRSGAALNRTKRELDSSGKRRGSNISLVSFVSSFDSASLTGRRPFSPLDHLPDNQTAQSVRGGHKNKRRSYHLSEHSQSQASMDAHSGGRCCSAARLKQFVPVLEWLPAYRWQEDFGADLVAGLAVATINITTSLSAAVVAQTDIGVAFKSSIFNAFVYSLLCTSRHNSFGSWSMLSQMLLDSVRRALGDQLVLSRIHLGPEAEWNLEQYEMWHMNIIIMYTFLIGLIQLLAGLLNLGNILASFIPEALCSSMIAATAFTMAVGQLANMCGTSNKLLWAIERNSTAQLNWADLKPRERANITDLFADLFRWFQQVSLLLTHRQQINHIACAISLTTVILLAINHNYLQPKLRAWLKRDLFLPSEMLLMIGWILISYWLNLRDAYQVTTCQAITIQFGPPNVPNLRLVRELWVDSLATALISFTMVFIMAKTYSNKFNYEVSNNQELIACGAGNLIGGLFDALPATASISRTAGQVESGGRTQMASLINCLVLVGLVHGLGEHVAHLPVCVMSAVLFYGFVRMMARTREALDYWRLCRVDFAIWLFTYVAILTFDLVSGFLYGFIFSLLSMLYRAQNRRCYLLGSIDDSDVYVPLSKYPLARELDRIKIFQFCGPIHYVCADLFEKRLRQKTRIDVKELLKRVEQQHRPHPSKSLQISNISHSIELGTSGGQATKVDQFKQMNLPSHIILDFSMISFLDTAGLRVIKKIIADYQRLNITIVLASLVSHVAQVVKSDPELWDNHKDRFYLTLADAVHHALRDNKPADCQVGKISTS